MGVRIWLFDGVEIIANEMAVDNMNNLINKAIMMWLKGMHMHQVRFYAI